MTEGSLAVTTQTLDNIVNHLKQIESAKRNFIMICGIVGIDKIDEQ